MKILLIAAAGILFYVWQKRTKAPCGAEKPEAGSPVNSGYGEKTRYAPGLKISFPDFTLEYAGTSRVQGPNKAKWYMTSHLFNISNGKDAAQVSWSGGAGDIAPFSFEFGGKKYNIEKAYSESAGRLENDELVISPVPRGR